MRRAAKRLKVKTRGRYDLNADRKKQTQKLLLDARPEQDEPYACDQQHDRNRWRDLRRLLFLHGCLDGAEFRNFFLLVVVEARVHQPNHTKNDKNDAEDDGKPLHGSNVSQEPIPG
jgi:hypothetical protein